MNEHSEHAAHCLCGDVELIAQGDPDFAAICHCRICQLRTGAPFGISVYFPEDAVRIERGALKTFENVSDESGRWFRWQFCARCGTTITWAAEFASHLRGVAGACFDEPDWYDIAFHVWTRSAHHWVPFPADVDIYETSTRNGSPLRLSTPGRQTFQR